MLLARSQRQVDTERVAAFAKRLTEVRGSGVLCLPTVPLTPSACAPQVAFGAETGESMSALAVVCELLNRHPKLRRLLARALLVCCTLPAAAVLLTLCTRPDRRTSRVRRAPTCRK